MTYDQTRGEACLEERLLAAVRLALRGGEDCRWTIRAIVRSWRRCEVRPQRPGAPTQIAFPFLRFSLLRHDTRHAADTRRKLQSFHCNLQSPRTIPNIGLDRTVTGVPRTVLASPWAGGFCGAFVFSVVKHVALCARARDLPRLCPISRLRPKCLCPGVGQRASARGSRQRAHAAGREPAVR